MLTIYDFSVAVVEDMFQLSLVSLHTLRSTIPVIYVCLA